MGLALVAAAIALATPQQFLLAHELPNGAFAERNGSADVTLTAWSLLALRAARANTDDRYLREHESDLQTPTELALGVLAESQPSASLVSRLATTPDTSTINGAIWKLLAFARLGRAPPQTALAFVLRNQTRTGGWSWAPHVAPDSNDTAVAIEGLRASGVAGFSIRRGIA